MAYFNTYFNSKRKGCNSLLEGFESVSSSLLEKFQGKEKEGLLFYQYAIYDFKKWCFGTEAEFQRQFRDIYLSKILNPELDLTNDTVVWPIVCPHCQKTSLQVVREWFQNDYNFEELINNNCSASNLPIDGKVSKWCSKCWIEKNECNKCWDQTKSKLVDICIYHKYPPKNWQFIDIFMTNFLQLSSHTIEQNAGQLRKFITRIAAKNNDLNVLHLWKFLLKPYLDTTYERYFSNEETFPNENEIKETLDALTSQDRLNMFEALQSPRIHGDYETEYVLVPFCSFGNQNLKKCDLFKRYHTFFKKDQVCYTFNIEGNYYSKNLHGGFHFLVNFRLPTNKALKPIKLILHSGNEIPNADYFLATTHDIESGTELKIGVEASITNVTSNFAAMVKSKRKCFLNTGENAWYSQGYCKMKKALKLATSECKCRPWFLVKNAPYCDPSGMDCFNNMTTKYLDLEFDEECPEECVTTQYSVSYDTGGINLKYNSKESKDEFGTEWQAYLDLDSPLYYADFNPSPKYALVHINFIRTEADVIVKDARVTFPDMLGSIGGTLGVFIGLSFVGLLDFLIWIWDSVKGMWSMKASKKKKHRSKLMI